MQRSIAIMDAESPALPALCNPSGEPRPA
jgi:hypothetical protein